MAVIHDSFVHQLNDCLAKKANGAIKQALILEQDVPIFRVFPTGTVVVSRVDITYQKTLIDMLSDADLFKSLADVEFACIATGADTRVQGVGDVLDYSLRIREGSQSGHLMVKNKLLRSLEKEDLERLV